MSLPTAMDKLFICPGCQRGGFKSIGAVKAHFESKGHKLACGPCDKSFGNVTALLKHSQKHEKPLDGSDLKSVKSAKPASKSAKQQNFQDLELLSAKPAKSAPKSVKYDKYPDLSESFVKPAKPSPKTTKQGKSQDSSEPLSVNLPKPTTKKTKLEKSQDLSEPLSINLAKSATKKTKLEMSQDLFEALSAKPTKSASKKTKTEKSEGLFEALSAKPAKSAPKKTNLEKSLDHSDILPAKSAKPAQKRTSNQAPVRAPVRVDTYEDLWNKTSEPGPPNSSSPAIQNANYHVILEPLEQNLIFRYLSARCHSDTRLVTRGFTFRAGLAEVSRRPSKRPPPKTGHFRQVPRSSDGLPKRKAIVLDCEMVQVEAGRRELAFLSAIDFLTGEVLINNYVQPKAKVVNWDSRFSGVTPGAMNKAVKKGTALNGWEGARSKLWEFMDSETILVGHSLNNDLDVLGIIHWNIVDSSIITGEAVFYNVHASEALNRTWSLKTLTNELVNYDIQVGKQGHSALEDAHATRDIVIWCLRYPEHLKVWADNARDQEEVRVYERELKRTTEEEAKEQKRKHDMEIKIQMLSRGVAGLDVQAIDLSDDDANDPDYSFVDHDGDGVEHEQVTIEAAAASFF
ncbi:Exonuclease RNase T/DNA polymerase III [Penicillium robsamsonii]|uniref:Exonuclease RNase T/DNA polymerase III n=1 Tax=Penicillium robsamsonii TaxID=1792511 RepID=UPI002547687F|nr:Exonuclease RNase T/DNA polymerase III [Penicillium robsamsonii]KAJ5822537.1 Exonuclease RNase T/DNA polymerase III [Penicillium robsamsonii]